MSDVGGTSCVATPDRPAWADVCAVGGEISLRTEASRPGRAHPVEVFTGPFTHAGHTFAVRGHQVPLAEVQCRGQAPILVPSERLLWRERGLHIAPQQQHAEPGGRAGKLLELSGTGTFACAVSRPGDVFMLYLPEGRGIEVRTGNVLCAAGLDAEPPEPGMAVRLDRFRAVGGDGLLLVHGGGGVYEIMLERGDSLRVARRALLYKEIDLSMVGLPGAIAPLRCHGPGVIAVQTNGGRG